MASHAQNQTPDPGQIVIDAATAIKAGQQLEDTTRMQAAGWATKLAADNGDTDMLDLIILVGAGELKDALHKLVNLSLGDGGQQNAAAPNPLDGLINPPGGASNGTASSTAAPQTPNNGATTPPTATPATAGRPRRNR